MYFLCLFQHSKIKSIGEIFQWACIKDKGDLFSVSPIDIRWQKLTSSGSIRYVTLADKHTLGESFEGLKNSVRNGVFRLLL